ncbi:MAG TPA: DUF202 domain-containing protein [Gemmataceae bacterium]|nr:DUF202 domain-containing protein [Gemmataceae bacterium]
MADDGQNARGTGSERPDSRLRLGLETTLLAWVRTGLALMGFGFVVARFGLFLREIEEAGRAHPGQVRASLWVGTTLIAVGVGVNLAAAVLHCPYLIRARRGEGDLPPTWGLGLVLSALLALVGVLMAVLLVVA